VPEAAKRKKGKAKPDSEETGAWRRRGPGIKQQQFISEKKMSRKAW
jgi:hypothetical protein